MDEGNSSASFPEITLISGFLLSLLNMTKCPVTRLKKKKCIPGQMPFSEILLKSRKPVSQADDVHATADGTHIPEPSPASIIQYCPKTVTLSVSAKP